jgi:hypothetical protein
MADLRFTTHGQAELLAAQEAVARKARETREEFEKGAKATQTWDGELAKLGRQGQSALRSIQTEQEKIAAKIEVIRSSQDKGLIPPPQAEEALRRLTERWVEVEDAARAAAEKTQSIPPPEDAIKGTGDLTRELSTAEIESSRLGRTLFKAFDPALLIKYLAGFAGIKAAIRALRDELEAAQKGIDDRASVFLEPGEREKKFTTDAAGLQADVDKQLQRTIEASQQIAVERGKADRAEAERQEKLAEQIGDTEERIRRRREDRERAIAKDEKDRSTLDRDVGEARRDLRDARTESAEKSARRRIRGLEDRRQNWDEFPTRDIDRGLRDLEGQRDRLQADAAAPGSRENVAQAQAAAKENAQALDRLTAQIKQLEADRTQFEASPEFQRFQTVESRGTAADEAFQNLATLADATQLSSDELEKFAALFRELGYSSLSTKLRTFVDRIDDGAVSVEEVIADLRATVYNIQQRADDKLLSGGGEFGGPGEVIPGSGRDLTTVERGQVLYVEQLINRLEPHNDEAKRARQRQIELLEQLLRSQQEGGLGVTGE